MRIITAIQKTDDFRTSVAAKLCLSSLARFTDLEIVKVPGTPRPFFNEMLIEASKGEGDFFGWINGDCQLLIHPKAIKPEYDVFGLRRIELGTGEKCGGVDGYIIKKSFWEGVLSKDMPKMYVGGTHIDWWITRATQKYGKYHEGFFLAHVPHPKSETSNGTSPEGKHNLLEYEKWAERNGVSKC